MCLCVPFIRRFHYFFGKSFLFLFLFCYPNFSTFISLWSSKKTGLEWSLHYLIRTIGYLFDWEIAYLILNDNIKLICQCNTNYIIQSNCHLLINCRKFGWCGSHENWKLHIYLIIEVIQLDNQQLKTAVSLNQELILKRMERNHFRWLGYFVRTIQRYPRRIYEVWSEGRRPTLDWWQYTERVLPFNQSSTCVVVCRPTVHR